VKKGRRCQKRRRKSEGGEHASREKDAPVKALSDGRSTVEDEFWKKLLEQGKELRV